MGVVIKPVFLCMPGPLSRPASAAPLAGFASAHLPDIYCGSTQSPLYMPSAFTNAQLLMASEIGGGSPSGPAFPPSGSGGGDGEGGGRVKGPWSAIPSLNASATDRVSAMLTMTSAEEIKNSIMVDLAGMKSDEAQLDYLNDVLSTMGSLAHGKGALKAREMTEVAHLVACAADGLTGSITASDVQMAEGLKEARDTMRQIVAVADRLERTILDSGDMDRATAGRLAHIYAIAALKGACCEANIARAETGVRDRAYKAHAARALLLLLDTAKRFRRLGKEGEEQNIMDRIEEFAEGNGITGAPQKWAMLTITKFLEDDIKYMHRRGGAKGEEVFRRNLTFAMQGNRSLGPAVLENCIGILYASGDAERYNRYTEWYRREIMLSELLALA
ncbi:MAG: hypothetical protein JXA24_03870 [Proteobacteria bacterium]|nr:hypothetical protein [Pseudomonadota bacterium]